MEFHINFILISEFRIFAIGNDFLISRIKFLITEKNNFYIIFIITVLYHIQNYSSKMVCWRVVPIARDYIGLDIPHIEIWRGK